MIRILTAICLLLAMSCASPEELSQKELNSYLQEEDKGLRKTSEDNSFKIVVTYRPTDFIAKQQMVGNTLKEYDSLRKVYSNYYYFIVDITREGKDLESYFALSPESFASKITVLSAGMAQFISLTTDKQKYSVTDYIYARSYGSGSSQLLVAFEKVEAQDFELEINGNELGFGKVRLPFESSDINKTPKLKL